MGVYFAEACGAGAIKIGLVDRPQGLLLRGVSLTAEASRAFRGLFERLRYLGCWPLANRADERALQYYFRHLRLAGEWFVADSDLRAYAAAMVPVDMAVAWASTDWDAYASAFDIPPLCADWLAEEEALPIRVRAPLLKWGVNPGARA